MLKHLSVAALSMLLAEDLRLITADDTISVIQDELQNTYQKATP